jgi:UDP-N-acetyl-D-galactosamine dehydrogenase
MADASPRIAVIGLGYVGLPLAVAFARHFAVTGYDRDGCRVEELRRGHDRTREVAGDELQRTRARFTADPAEMRGAGIFIVTVPTPVDETNEPDLTAVREACRTAGAVLGKGAIVVLESTVYPGVTEEVCGPVLAKASGLTCGGDFFLGYSPERINPGDHAHTLARIVKVVAGQTPETAATLARVYGAVCEAGVHLAPDIRTAEAAKVIENAQRDINIAFVNEVAMIVAKLGLSVYDVLEAAGTKWNFLPFSPGLVGGHCIGVDPFYLAHKARAIGHEPEVILAGRRINDAMGDFLAACISEALAKPSRILVLGLTFKENVPDLRNSKVADLIKGLTARGHAVRVADPLADPGEAAEHYGIELVARIEEEAPYDGVVGAVPHDPYRKLRGEDFARLVTAGGLVADIKGMWRGLDLPAGLRRWQL